MEIHPSVWTKLVASILGVEDLHHFAYYDHVVAASIAFIICVIIALRTKTKISMVPSHFQQVVELVMEGILGMLNENMGARGRRYIPIVGTLAFFIFVGNLLGLIPTFSSSTSNFNTTVACAVIVFIYYNFEGVRENGFGYLKHFLGPILFIAPLMIVIEIISHLARPFSLSVRLFFNISGEHIVAGIIYGMLPVLVPIPLMALGLFAAVLQTFIFVILTTLYLTSATEHEH
ncbi:MAG: F0F1 ATP synthase subunit A [Acidobacteria bacterium]|nr:F0F1 ATP synthase subunit A [Acidobacteriota bacterium]